MEWSARMRLPIIGTTALGTLFLFLVAACGEGPQRSRPQRAPTQPTNLVLIVVDTLRADAIRARDGTVLLPSLDGLARDGVVFDQCYSHAPITLPSHAALFSSRLPFETRVLTNEDHVPQDLPLVAEHLAQQGYATSAVVSMPLQALGRGFEVFRRPVLGSSLAPAEDVLPLIEEALSSLTAERPFFLFAHLSDPHDPYRAHGTIERSAEILLDGEVLETVTTSMAPIWTKTVELEPGEHRLEVRSAENLFVRFFRVGARGIDFSFEVGDLFTPLKRAVVKLAVAGDQKREVPLQLWVEDRVAPGEEILRRYALEVEHADSFVGKILDGLRQRGLYDDALIVFTSDHGEGLGQHDWWVHVQNVFDELLRVPLIIKPPAWFDAADLRSNARELVRHVDVLPTCVQIMGVAPLPEMRGTSLCLDAERLLVAQTHKPIAPRNLVCARDERYKLILDADSGIFEMYDIVSDPGETVDVFAERGHEREEWQGMLEAIASSSKRDEQPALDEERREELRALGY